MAPDLNSVPASARPPQPSHPEAPPQPQAQAQPPSRRPSATPSRRSSTQIYPMNPPPLPLSTPGGGVPLSINAAGGAVPFPPLSPVTSSSSTMGSSALEVGVPMRHPRPMTPAEMCAELEREQEAIVNRLTRELSALRAHSNSVASTASLSSISTSTSISASGPAVHAIDPGAAIPTRTRAHRSSSSLSRTASSQLSMTNLADATASTPSAAARTPSISAAGGGGGASASGGPYMPATPRYEEILAQRAEMEEVRRENERLRKRVRELEGLVRGRRGSSSAATGGGGSGSGGGVQVGASEQGDGSSG